MAKSQVNGTPILIVLEGYEVGKVIGKEGGIVVEVGTELRKTACSRCNSVKLYRRGRAKKGEWFMDGVIVRKSTPTLLVIAGDVAIVDISSPRV